MGSILIFVVFDWSLRSGGMRIEGWGGIKKVEGRKEGKCSNRIGLDRMGFGGVCEVDV